MRLSDIADEALEAMGAEYLTRAELAEHHQLPTAKHLKVYAAILP